MAESSHAIASQRRDTAQKTASRRSKKQSTHAHNSSGDRSKFLGVSVCTKTALFKSDIWDREQKKNVYLGSFNKVYDCP